MVGNPTVNIDEVEGGKAYDGSSDTGVTTVKDNQNNVVEIHKTLTNDTTFPAQTLWPQLQASLPPSCFLHGMVWVSTPLSVRLALEAPEDVRWVLKGDAEELA